jgi:hypothetical protein
MENKLNTLKDNMTDLCDTIFHGYDSQGLLNVKYNLMNAVEDAFWSYARKNYWIISWDSPLGEDSEDILKSVGFIALWKGIPGHRGEAILFLPKDKYKECPKDIRKWFTELVRIYHRYEKLLYVFDKYSKFDVEGETNE